jgi:hypothetical protein
MVEAGETRFMTMPDCPECLHSMGRLQETPGDSGEAWKNRKSLRIKPSLPEATRHHRFAETPLIGFDPRSPLIFSSEFTRNNHVAEAAKAAKGGSHGQRAVGIVPPVSRKPASQ